ncbi:MAG TPA: hypothetical protein VNL14_16525 [Candidatus Acidoferrales bacterium]|nr:hypothetical protein [Candidatus Acidoferrales bacterium]
MAHVARWPAFYICWICKTVAQVGVGPVNDLDRREVIKRQD